MLKINSNISSQSSLNKNCSQPSFNGRLVPTPISYKYENLIFKNILSPIMDFKASKYPAKIRKTIKPFIKKVNIPIKKGSLYAWELNPENSKKYILFLHGIKGKSTVPPNQIFFEKVMGKNGYGIITPEYRGTARLHKQAFTFNNTTEDAKAVLNYLFSKGIKPKDITIAAHCIGSIPAAHIAASEKNLNGIILISPISNGNEFGTSLLRTLNLKVPKILETFMNKITSLFMPYDMNINKIMKDIDTPVTIIMPKHDKLISISQAIELGKGVKNLKNFIVVPEQPHSLTKTNCEKIVEQL